MPILKPRKTKRKTGHSYRPNPNKYKTRLFAIRIHHPSGAEVWAFRVKDIDHSKFQYDMTTEKGLASRFLSHHAAKSYAQRITASNGGRTSIVEV